MKKKVLSFLLSMVLIISFSPLCLPVVAAKNNVSGDLDVSKPSKADIQAMWNTVTYNTSKVYATEPSASAPYKIGKLTDAFLDNGLSFLNYVRYVAGLPAVQMDESLNENAQYGATLLAATNTLTHYPTKPSDMDTAFYEQGYEATTSSNLGLGYGSLASHIQGCMDDDDYNNIDRVGHRRWLLNPKLLNVGFGFASYYSATKVFDKSGKECNYEFVSWPPSGYFPTHLISNEAPWSVSLNPNEYRDPVLENISVTITQENDGTIWNLNGEHSSNIATGYLTVNNERYGGLSCIIFHPGWSHTDGYNGIYTVEIEGLYTKDGDKTKLCYQVDFFDIKDTSSSTPVCHQYSDTCDITCNICGYRRTAPHIYTNLCDDSCNICNHIRAAHTYDNDSDATCNMCGELREYAYYCLDEKTYVTRYLGNGGAVTIPYSLGGYPVVSIGYAAFEGCSSLTSVTIPNSVTRIVALAFAQCYNLSSVTIAESVMTIEDLAFWRCDSLITVRYGGSSVNRDKMTISDYGNSVLFDNAWRYNYRPATIVTQPKNATAKKDAYAKITVEATGDGLTYAWYLRDVSDTCLTLSSQKTNVYKQLMNEEGHNREIFCVITDKYGNTVTSNTVYARMLPTITIQPKTTYTQYDKIARITASATGDSLTYQWYIKSVGQSVYSKSSITKSVYTAKMSDKAKDRLVYCVVTDKYGNTARTETVRLRMAATITDESATATYAQMGKKASVSVTAVGDGLTYTWYIKNDGQTKYSKSAITTATYTTTMSKTTKNCRLYCVVKDKYGNKVVSKTFLLREAVSITDESATATYTQMGKKTSVSVAAAGDGLAYTWYIKNDGQTKYSKSSITTATYTTVMSKTTKDRRLYCLVTDKYGNKVESKTFLLREAVSIITQPKSKTVAKGEKVTVTVGASGDGLRYEWYIKNEGQTKYSKSSITTASYTTKMSATTNGRRLICYVYDKYGNKVQAVTVVIKMK